MFKLLVSLGAALLGIFTTGCNGTAGQIKTTIDGVDVEAGTTGTGGVSLTVGTDAGSVTVSGQLGHHPEVIAGPAATQPAAVQNVVDAAK